MNDNLISCEQRSPNCSSTHLFPTAVPEATSRSRNFLNVFLTHRTVAWRAHSSESQETVRPNCSWVCASPGMTLNIFSWFTSPFTAEMTEYKRTFNAIIQECKARVCVLHSSSQRLIFPVSLAFDFFFFGWHCASGSHPRRVEGDGRHWWHFNATLKHWF